MVTGSRGKRSVTRCIGVRFIRPFRVLLDRTSAERQEE
uniref:Uncharacterized protein n=1 Tax=Anguilla anguilla TaxID=7936 RepID=A0A0E9TZY3_ANGAN